MDEDRQRKIIHADMDAFYASVEQRDNLDLRGKPVAVGGSRERGVVAAASYEARKFGVRSAMPSVTAKRQCPDLIFVKPRFETYKAISQQIREILAEHTPIIEPLSLDEAYLDVTENPRNIPLARDVALAIRAKIKEVTGLNASAGISYNKFLAKLASDHRKPNGQFVITPGMGLAFVEGLPVGKFHSIGPATKAKMNSLGLYTGLDIRNQTLEFMQAHFGKAGGVLLLDIESYRQSGSPGKSDPEIGRRREHVLKRPHRVRIHGCRTAAADRQGLAALRRQGLPRPDGDPESEVQRLRDHHPQQVGPFCGLEPQRPRTPLGRPAAGRDAPSQACAPTGGFAILAAGRRAGPSATWSSDLSGVNARGRTSTRLRPRSPKRILPRSRASTVICLAEMVLKLS
jgi:DNA polymerase IV